MKSNNELVEVRSDGTKRVKIYFDKVDEETGELLTPSLTKQAFKKDCDINSIMAKYEKSGVVDHFAKHQGHYGDYSNVQDYQSAMNQVIEANEMFMSLPAQIRKEFDNDPGQFLDKVSDPAYKDRMIELGLISPETLESQENVSGSTEEPENGAM